MAPASRRRFCPVYRPDKLPESHRRHDTAPSRLFVKQNRDSIIGKSTFCIPRTSAHDCGMIFACLDSLFEKIGEGLQVGRRVMQDEGRDVTSGVAVVQQARTARVARIAQSRSPLDRSFELTIPSCSSTDSFPAASEKSSTANRTPSRSATAIPTNRVARREGWRGAAASSSTPGEWSPHWAPRLYFPREN